MNKFRVYIMTSLMAALVSLGPAWAQMPSKTQEESAEPKKPMLSQTIAESMRNGHVLLNFENIDIRVLSRMMSELTGRNIIVDEKVNGKLTILSSRQVSIPEAWDIFKAAINRYGYSIMNKGDYVQIIPNNVARNRGAMVPALQANPAGDDYVMAVLIMSQGDPEAVVNSVKPLLSENGVISAYKQGLAILIVDQASIVNRIGQIVKRIDTMEPTIKTEVIFPVYMEADKVVNAIKPLFKEQEGRNTFSMVAFGPSNAVIVNALPRDLQSVKRILKTLDIRTAAPVRTEPARFYVYNLQFAQAEDVAKILSEMISERQKAVNDRLKEPKIPGSRENKPESNTNNGNVADSDSPTEAGGEVSGDTPLTVGFTSSKVSADKETNSLVLYVSPSEYKDLEQIISKLDDERNQIQISAIVAEVSLKRVKQLGIGWQAITAGGLIGSYKGGLTEEGLLNVLAGGNFVGGVVGGNTRTITVSNQSVDVPEFFAYLSALNSNNDFNLISAPRVLTQDNKKATINVGQVVPFATGGKLDAYGSPTVTFDYREVGIKLEVTPHVSNGSKNSTNKQGVSKIRMDVKQEIQEVTEYLNQEMAGVSFSAPVVSNRSVNTTVTIPDGKTLLIGGLISKRTTDQVKGIPILKDLPIIGGLFRDKSTDDQKTSIFISLTPKIVDLDEQEDRYDASVVPYLNDIGNAGDQNYENRDTDVEADPKVPTYEQSGGLNVFPAGSSSEASPKNEASLPQDVTSAQIQQKTTASAQNASLSKKNGNRTARYQAKSPASLKNRKQIANGQKQKEASTGLEASQNLQTPLAQPTEGDNLTASVRSNYKNKRKSAHQRRRVFDRMPAGEIISTDSKVSDLRNGASSVASKETVDSVNAENVPANSEASASEVPYEQAPTRALRVLPPNHQSDPTENSPTVSEDQEQPKQEQVMPTRIHLGQAFE